MTEAGAKKVGIGDVNSDEKGSGARYNDGKPPMFYVPLRQQMLVWSAFPDKMPKQRWEVIRRLAAFEMHKASMTSVVAALTMDDVRAATYVWEYGANKYKAWNWAKGMDWSIPLACISRHVQAILDGEDLDNESGCPHWAHVVCNLLMLEHYTLYYKAGDDRPPANVFDRG